MTLFGAIALVLMAIIGANLLAQMYPTIPQAFWQIIMGILIAFIPGVGAQLIINPEWFMLLIIAPLLFYEGQQTPLSVLSKNFGAIIKLAVILAIVTVIIVAISAEQILLWPIPLAVALAAIVTPTDATALDSVTAGVEMPSGLQKAMTLESLFNDAVGLVVLELAFLWLATGRFSFWEASTVFMVAAIGGVIVGVLLGIALVYIRQHLMRYQLNDMTAQLLLQILSPMFIYMIADSLHVSAIIAVVIAGVVHNEEREKLQFMSTKFSNLSNQVWHVIAQVLNGVVFVLLGSGLVRILVDNENTPWQTLVWLTWVSVIIYVVMLVVRYIARSRSNRKHIAEAFETEEKYHKRDALIFSVGGVHGAMTMAMALSVPFVLDNGNVVPFRDEILYIAIIVIILSLVVPLIVLPRILPKVTPEYSSEEFQEAHLRMIQAGMNYVENQDVPQSTQAVIYDHLKRQVGYEQPFEKDVWAQANQILADANIATIQEAMADNQISSDALLLYQRMMAQEQRKLGMSRFHIIGHKIMARIDRLATHFLSEEKREEQQKARVEHFLQYEEDRIALLPAEKQPELKALLDHQREFMKDASSNDWKQHLTTFKDNEHERWNHAAIELDTLLSPPVDVEIAELEQNPENTQLILAMRKIMQRRQHNVEAAVQSDKEVHGVLFAALQAELTQVQDSLANHEISHSLATTLCSEITAAQALIMETESGTY